LVCGIRLNRWNDRRLIDFAAVRIAAVKPSACGAPLRGFGA
jgi:hypothetical protein